MSSRAYLLLERENRKLKKNNYKGISAFPVSEDLLEWEAVIEGLQDTIWQGLFFQLKINFTLKYNLAPPFVKFKTIPFHPNVDQHTGQPCIDFLDNPNKWNTSYTLSSILLTLQVMLSNPVLENPVNLEAAKILTKDESKYRLIVLKLFQQPLQLKDESPKTPKKPDKIIKSTKTISFYDYYKSWCEIATSKATGYHRTARMLLSWLGLLEKKIGITKTMIQLKENITSQLQFTFLLIHKVKQKLSQRFMNQMQIGRMTN
ncbi:ubiquitin-conjugating enzyme E2 U isoform X4 [Talpa occidentalis]|uniref:ubiquitin-conjugating enzyme E2 U isoform X4 n=1 Tax=Talpa occidentalis TaxID=50954 RepID=UPI00188E4EC2|nr:ubiquitin-conjugating enzyme E2 U isoform X4 [Talpa occidentalis]